MIEVSVAGVNGDAAKAKRLSQEISDPRRVGALTEALKFLKASNSVPWNDLYIATTAEQSYAGVLVGMDGNDYMIRVSGNPQDGSRSETSTTVQKICPEATTLL